MSGFMAARLHYRSFVRLECVAEDKVKAWERFIKLVRSWVTACVGDARTDDLGRAWFFHGGSWRNNYCTIETTTHVGQGHESNPESWALRVSHPDRDFHHRTWTVDVGLLALDRIGQFACSVTVSHRLRHEYMGKEPESPSPSAPGLMRRLLSDRSWRVFAGDEELSLLPEVLEPGHGLRLRDRLLSRERQRPLVIISREPEGGLLKVDPDRLAKLTAGAAIVLEAKDATVGEELDWCLPSGFGCSFGMVRVYFPRLESKRERDSRRHRFFRPEQIDELGAQEVENQIAATVCRRVPVPSGAAPLSVEAVMRQAREVRLAALTQSGASQEDQGELIDIYKEEVEDLARQLSTARADFDQLATAHEQLEDEEADLRDRLDVASRTLDRSQQEAAHFREQNSSLGSEVRSAKRQRELLADRLAQLPSDTQGALEIVSLLFPDRLVFTDKAKESAKDRDKSETDMGVVWRCLYAIGRDLYDLCFHEADDDESVGSLPDRFQDRTGLELALTEKKATKKDSRLMGLRQAQYRNKSGHESVVDITPHVKGGSKGKKLFRVYFHIHREDRVIVVGHCGDHLETAGTRRM